MGGPEKGQGTKNTKLKDVSVGRQELSWRGASCRANWGEAEFWVVAAASCIKRGSSDK